MENLTCFRETSGFQENQVQNHMSRQ